MVKRSWEKQEQVFVFFKQKTAYELRPRDWSSDVCSSDLACRKRNAQPVAGAHFVYGRPANTTDNSGFVSFKTGQTNTAGEFTLEHLKPGHYALYISSSLDRRDLYSDVLNFDVVDADVTNLEVQARHGSTLSGFVVPAGVTSATTLAALTSVKVVAAVPSIGNLRAGIANVTPISPDGSFQFTGLRPGIAFINLKADNPNLNGV